MREDEGLLNETLKGTVGRFVGILSKDDVARYLVWSQCDPKEAILIKAMRIPLREPMVSVTATMAEALEVVSKELRYEDIIPRCTSNDGDDSSQEDMDGLEKNKGNIFFTIPVQKTDDVLVWHFSTYALPKSWSSASSPP